jgi:hypothetical protein
MLFFFDLRILITPLVYSDSSNCLFYQMSLQVFVSPLLRCPLRFPHENDKNKKDKWTNNDLVMFIT